MCNHNPIFCVLPPHILNSLIENGDHACRKHAMDTLTSANRLQGQREVLGRYDLRKKDFGKFRVIQTADNRQALKGVIARKEGQDPVGDAAVDEAYDNTGHVYDFYYNAYNRNSLDGNGQKIFSTVHYGNKFSNAFWNGERMVFGDGDGKVFGRFTSCIEVIGHELTHGVQNEKIQLAYQDQSGALCEAISDVFGCLSKQMALGQTADQADWIIGEGLFTKNVQGVGIRSLKEPGTAYKDNVLGKDPCPATMSGYVNTSDDNGGIHINCTIPGHAFYLAATKLGGNAWEGAGRVWYNTITRRVNDENIDFKHFAELTIKVANKIFGESPEKKAIEHSWNQVGVL